MRQTHIDCGAVTGGLFVSALPDHDSVLIQPQSVTPFAVSLHLTADQAASLRDELTEALKLLTEAKIGHDLVGGGR